MFSFVLAPLVPPEGMTKEAVDNEVSLVPQQKPETVVSSQYLAIVVLRSGANGFLTSRSKQKTVCY
jgi:hypothetical protein